jgi:hypothetical protein
VRISRNKTHVGFRLSQKEADDLAAALAASPESKKLSPGAYAKQALLGKLGGGPQQELLAALQAIREELLARLEAHKAEIASLQAQLARFRDEFVAALPE